MSLPVRATASAAVGALVLSAVLLGQPAPVAAAPVEIQILTINDFHGRLEPPSEGVGGAAQIAGLLTQLRAEGPTSFVSGGDNIGASPFVSAVDQDNPTLDVLTAMGLDVATVGNHEFDQGVDDLIDRVVPRAGFTYLGANVYEGDERVLPAYEVVDVGGVDVGYVGVVTEETPSLVSPAGIAGLTFTDPVAEAEAVAAELSDGNAANGEADVVVLLTHEGAGPASIGSAAALAADPVFGEFVAMSADVDAIVSGHTHQTYAFDVPIPGTGRTRPIVQANEYGRVLGRIQLTVDPATDVVSAGTASVIDVTGITPDPAIAQMVQDAVDQSVVLGAEPIGTITGDILRGGTPPGSDRGVESVMGNFVADAQRAQTAAPGRGGAQIALMNPGGLRADLLYDSNPTRPGDADGVVTYSEAFEVQPFANDVVTKTYTGAQIEQVLEEQWQPPGASRPVLWLGVSEGFTYAYSPGAPKGHRINAGSVQLDGVPLTPDGEYRVTVNSFLAAGGDNFTTLAGGTDPVTTGDNDLTMLVAHFAATSPVTADPEPRSVEATPGAPELGPFADVEAAVDQQVADLLDDGLPTAERLALAARLYYGTATLEQIALELHAPPSVGSPGSQVSRLYLGLFGRPPSVAEEAYWTDVLATPGWSITRIAGFFASSPEFRARYGDATHEEFATLLYTDVLGRTPGDAEVQYWVDRLGSGTSRAKVLLLFTESAEHRGGTTTALRLRDLAVRMLGRSLSAAELDGFLDALTAGRTSLTEAIAGILQSDEYAAAVA